MMIKVNSEYLDFDGDVETESQIKLFDEISTSNGDFSYSFELSKTSKNLKALGFPYPDSVKSIYQSVPCELLDESGFKINTGSLQIERVDEVINCSFFGGNSDWFGLLSDPMIALPLYKYDTDLSEANITASWTKTKGLVFPILDTGTLVTRSHSNLMVEDFTPCFYVKTLFQEIFGSKGIKIKGELLQDATFNLLTVAANSKNQGDSLEDRSCYVKKTVEQNGILVSEKITFQDETNKPYFDGDSNNFSNSTYTADIKMRVTIDLVFDLFLNSGSGGVRGSTKIYKNGSPIKTWNTFLSSIIPGQQFDFAESTSIIIEAGDTIEVYMVVTDLGAGASVSVRQGTIRVTPNFSYGIYRINGSASVPNWTQAEFVSNILRVFNVLPSFNGDSKTLTLNLFNKLKDKTPIDISEDITIISTDFTKFVSSYGKNNYFNYQESSDEDLKQYNISNFIQYGSGNLTVDNDYLNNEADVIDSDFTAPTTYINPIFDMSMERINFAELEEIDSKDITGVTDSSGTPRFNMSNADTLFQVGDLVRIETGSDDEFEYEGEWVVNAVTSTYITVNGLSYGTNADGTATLLRHKFTTDDSVYLFVNVPNVNTLFFSSKNLINLEDASTFSNTSIAYFNLLNNGRQINTKYKQSLSFGTVNDPLSDQMTILQTYWGIFSQVLADPVLLSVDAYFNKQKYTQLKTFLSPIRIKTNETNNLYYLNRISGYKSGSEPCEAELIKL